MSGEVRDCSVVVCTRNRAERLATTLRAVLQQDYDPARLEIVVVDNGSSDGTRSVVEGAAEGARFPVHYVSEPRTGLSHARNRGVERAGGRIVAFLDDDAWPKESDWAAKLVAAYGDPRVAAAGGDLVPVWPGAGRPAWLHAFLLPSLGLTRFDHAGVVDTHYPLYPWGANLSFRRERVRALGGFSPRLGRQGAAPLSGEETELCLRLEQAGERVLYVPDAAVCHDMRGKDLSLAALLRYAAFQGESDARIERANFSRLRLARSVARRIALLGLGAGGSVLFSARRAPAWWALSRFELRASCAYLGALRSAGAAPAAPAEGPGDADPD